MKKNHAPEVIYQVYPASFNDSNGDGHGDLKGITQKLDYIKSLGVDAIWISPFFESPPGKAGDGGYAINDYRKIGQNFGNMEDFDNLLKKAHEKGLRIYTDFVMCHTSDEHEWFKKSVNREPGYEDRYVWSDGRRNEKNGELILVDGKPIPPNNWLSTFGGSAWEFNDTRKQFYLHHFAKSQPALNANNDNVQDKVIGEMKFWLDRGVDGLRLDALPFANYNPGLKDNTWRYNSNSWDAQYFNHSICQPQTVEYVAKIRKMFDKYPGKITIGESIAGRDGGYNPMPVARDYVNPETGLHTCYTERLYWRYPSASELKGKFEYALKEFPNGAFCNMLSNHDFARIDPALLPENIPEDLRKSAYKQLMAINLSLPGYVCIYQGDELGLANAILHKDIPGDKIKDLADNGRRDGSRTPMPWDSSKPNAGFSTSDDPYLPVPKNHYASAVNEQESERNSILHFTREIIADRKSNPALQEGTTKILNTPEPIFAFTRHIDEHTDENGKKIPAQTVLFMANMGIHTQMVSPSSFLDEKTMKTLNLSDDPIIMSGYSYTRRGLLNHKKTHELEASENGHIGTNIFAADMLLADVFHRKEDADGFIKKHNIQPMQRLSIGQEEHNELSSLPGDHRKTTIGGSTLLTLSTLKKLNPNVNVDYMGMVADDEHGKLIKNHLQETKINLLTPNWPDGIKPETGTTHIIKDNSHEILATYSGAATEALYRALDHDPQLLEKSIKKADIIYLPGSIMEKFGKSFVDDILHLRWKHRKELVLSLPVHANFGHDDPDVFKRLIQSSNIVVGNDVEYCRIFGIDAARPTSDAHMDIVTKGIQEAFKGEILRNNSMPCKSEPVAFITRNDKDALLVTATEVKKIPVAKINNVNHSLGSGDTATAAFLDAELRGLTHEQSAKFAMAMGAEKARQKNHSPYLENPANSRELALKRNTMNDIAKSYNPTASKHPQREMRI